MIWSWKLASSPGRSRVHGVAALSLALGVLLPAAVQGQGFGPDPFQPYNAQYAPFVTPVAPGPLDYGYYNAPGRGIRGANQFQDYLNSLETRAAGSRAGGSGVGVPYFQPNRAYDEEFGRVYKPNEAADRRFNDNQASLNQLYFDYLREKDPKKRAELFRNYNRARSRADRELAFPRNARGSQTASRASRREGRSTDTEAATGSRDRDLLTPPPLSSDTARTRARSSRSSSGNSSLGPPPSPLGGSRASSSTGAGATPSQVLDRSIRKERERSRVARPRPLAPGTSATGTGTDLGTAPPP